MTELGPAAPVLTPEEVIARHSRALEECVKAPDDQTGMVERQVLLNQARQHLLMVKGQHYLVPTEVATQWGNIADYAPFDPGAGMAEESGADIRLCPVWNYLGGDLYKFMAVMGAAAPRVKAVADNPHSTENIEAAKNADANIRDLWVKNHVDRQWKALAFHQYTTGPCFVRGQWVVDGKKYGQSVEPKIEMQPGPDGIPAPVEVGTEVYENGDAELRIYSVLDVSFPFSAKTREELTYLDCEEMRSKWDLIATYPDKLGKYRTDDLPDDDLNAASTTAQEAKEASTNPSGTGRSRRPNQWRFRESWRSPIFYEAVQDEETRELLKRQYPDGLYIAKAGSVIVKIDNRKVTDEWTVCKVGRGDKIMERPICADSVPLQRAVNDLGGMALETVLRAITQTIMDSQLVDRNKMATKEAVPAEIILTALPVDGDLAKKVYQIPPARLSDQVVPLFGQFRTGMQEITGIRPELTGGGPVANTFREAKQRKDQALMQLAPHAQEMQYAAADIAEILVKLRAKYGSGTINSPRKGAYGTEVDVVDMADLSDSGWHAEADDNFPMNAGDRFDKMWALLKEFPPEVQQALSIMDPINLEETLEILQIPGYESVVEDHKRKTLADVAQLLDAQPIEGPDGMQPSLPIDAYDNHQFVASFLQVWMVSRTGQREKNARPQGFENVRLFWEAHQQAAQPPAPPQAPALRGNLNLSAKLEDFPSLIPEALKGAGMDAPPQPVQPVQQPEEVGAPGPAEDVNPNAIPPLPESGPQPE